MKALIYARPVGPEGMEVADLPTPVPRDRQILVEVAYAGINVTDYRLLPSGPRPGPAVRAAQRMTGMVGRPPGGEVCGVVVDVGRRVTRFRVGDTVFGKTPGLLPHGGMAQYAVLDEGWAWPKPEALSPVEAAVLPVPFETALGAVRKAGVGPGDEVLIHGASGGVGHNAIQIAVAKGARVTGVCSTRNVAAARELGCREVVDYREQDFRELTTRFDTILGINGDRRLGDYLAMLAPDGVFVAVGGSGRQSVLPMFVSPFDRRVTVYAAPQSPMPDALRIAARLADHGRLRPRIDRVYPVRGFADAVAYITGEHARGRVAVAVDF